jgi:hypothetical protein
VLGTSQVPSSITSHAAGCIDRKNEIIFGLQTGAPLKRAILPSGGLHGLERTHSLRDMSYQERSAESGKSVKGCARSFRNASESSVHRESGTQGSNMRRSNERGTFIGSTAPSRTNGRTSGI